MDRAASEMRSQGEVTWIAMVVALDHAAEQLRKAAQVTWIAMVVALGRFP
jgi:hypothetical protein